MNAPTRAGAWPRVLHTLLYTEEHSLVESLVAIADLVTRMHVEPEALMAREQYVVSTATRPRYRTPELLRTARSLRKSASRLQFLG